MRAVLKLESIGDNLQGFAPAIMGGSGLTGSMVAASVVGRMSNKMQMFALTPRKRPWVARIRGLHKHYKYDREFIKGTKDYSEANSTGSRGVYYWFTLTDGLYEIYQHVSWKNASRYFAKVENTEITAITEEELVQCLNSKSPLAAPY